MLSTFECEFVSHARARCPPAPPPHAAWPPGVSAAPPPASSPSTSRKSACGGNDAPRRCVRKAHRGTPDASDTTATRAARSSLPANQRRLLRQYWYVCCASKASGLRLSTWRGAARRSMRACTQPRRRRLLLGGRRAAASACARRRRGGGTKVRQELAQFEWLNISGNSTK
jgi:hypothetical protein